ncbi:MAG TPA: hypothetical protein VMW17_13985 [Candidatus Binatia bacterium]|nr:hypothetical protein [Candidatus Binatia bacterium]
MILSNPYANGFREAEWNPLHAVVTGACKTELPLHRVGNRAEDRPRVAIPRALR